MASKSAYDTRPEAYPGEPKMSHFDDAVHKATFAAVIKSRAHQNDELTFDGEPKGDD